MVILEIQKTGVGRLHKYRKCSAGPEKTRDIGELYDGSRSGGVCGLEETGGRCKSINAFKGKKTTQGESVTHVPLKKKRSMDNGIFPRKGV